MKKYLYHIECVTNLHVGSGDANYDIVDNEVEKDPITGFPVIHSSGIKGALRDAYAKRTDVADAQISKIFGSPCKQDEAGSAGSVTFFNAQFISRPLRAQGAVPYVNTTHLTALRDYVDLITAFGFPTDGIVVPENIDFGKYEFLATINNVQIEGEQTKKLADTVVPGLKGLLGDNFAVARCFDHYPLPVVARNNLQTESGNLWYEEFVPYHTRFAFIVLAPDDVDIDDVIPPMAQIGGNASIGCGYCRFTKQFPENQQVSGGNEK